MSLISNFPRGAESHKWDLHVHTPNSVVFHYERENNELHWKQFILST